VSFAALPTSGMPVAPVTGVSQFSIPDAAYIHMIGVCAAFRGWKLNDGTRMGTFVLRAALNQIAIECKRMPVVWAYVHEDNRASHRMFEGVDFGLIKRPRPDQQTETVRYRPAGLEVFRSLAALQAI
jgi:hypothetical protein